ncbi:MAG: RagB/SusD family nutrient uptake outer membrane protein, partial [Balneolaceae bacterium]
MKKLIVVFIGILVLASCDNFLVESPKTQIALDQFFNSPEDARSAVNALYRDGAGAFYHEDAGFRGSRAMMGGYMSGLFDNEGKGERIEGQIAHDLDLDPVNLSQFLGQTWARLYRTITRANIAISRIPDMEAISEAESQQLLAEARFFRAFNYFYLVQTFGDVPLVLEPVEGLQDINVPRDDSESIYNQIITDLNWAIESGGLPDASFPDNNYRITEGAAATLLADVYLQMAGYPVQADEAYADAADAARLVIQGGAHSLVEHGASEDQSAYNEMRSSDNLDEYIYVIEYDTEIAPNPTPRITVPGVVRPSGILYSRTLNMYRPIDEFM